MENNTQRLLNKLLKEEIKSLKRVQDTFDDRFDYIRLDKKERLIGFEENSFNAFKNSLKSVDLSGYAEIGLTYKMLADYIGVKPQEIFLASGSDLAIKSIYEACLGKGDHVVLHRPSYAMFRVYGNMFGVEVTTVAVKDDWTVDFDAMLAQVKPNTKMFVVENPNGFVGTKPSWEELEKTAAELCKRDILFLIDEAYYYIEESKSRTHQLIEKYPNVLISQTFSKGHGLAGLRFGYLIGNEHVIEAIARVRPMHEITSFTAKAAEWVLQHPELLSENQAAVRKAKDIMIEGLKQLGVNVRDSHANFILAYFPDEGETAGMTPKLKEKKILIRRPFEEDYLKGWSLICAGSEETSQRLVAAVGEILEKASSKTGK